MPLFYQHNINRSTRLAIWKITETEDFFLKKVPLQNNITHWHKRLQHLAGRYLLQVLYPGFPYHLIEIADTKKPYLPDEEYHFSISHCGDFAAVIMSEHQRVGIDIELISKKVALIQHKFLSGQEQSLFKKNDLQQLTLMWSCKEAVFKWFGNGGVDFKRNIMLQKIEGTGERGVVKCLFSKDQIEKDLEICFLFFETLSFAWVAD